MNIYRRFKDVMGVSVAMTLVLAACSGQAEETATTEPVEIVAESAPAEDVPQDSEEETEEVVNVTNAVSVEDQALDSDNTVTVAAITSDVDSWIVIHAQADGRPGPILGKAPVAPGQNDGVIVEIDPTAATQTLYAMLHIDAGAAGEFDFPGGEDIPATDVSGNVVTPSFNINFSNSVFAGDQELSDDSSVIIPEVISAGPGWLVVHADVEGSPGPILGQTAVQAGVNSDVLVTIDAAGVTETLYAMLHVDAGNIGDFDFPNGEDIPATDDSGNVVTPPFTVVDGQSTATSLLLAESPDLGTYITYADGMTLYTFAIDVPGTSNCYDRCAAIWPPLLSEKGEQLTLPEGVSGELGTTERDDGTIQVTYNEWPLYYWINDTAPGDTTGHNVNNVWAVAHPQVQVLLGGNDDLGRFLVGPKGMTLYRFNQDEPGTSNCYEECAANWPPLLLNNGERPYGNAGVVGELSTTVRDNGKTQITYQGMPLYYWINDEKPGDTTGNGVGGVWFVVPPYTVRLGNNEELGDFLVGAKGMTLYMFTVDEENVSNCSDQCAINWPPLLVRKGEVPVAGVGVMAPLGVTKRDDGTFQVTYDGMPLYFWINDEAPRDTTGQGVNDVWFVVEP